MSALANYVVVGMPGTAAANALNHAISGLLSGFLACFFGVLACLRKRDGHMTASRDRTRNAAEDVPATPAEATAAPAP